MKAVCPKNSTHNRFTTTGHVVQEWVVDSNGNFIEVISDLEVTHGPDTGNIWTCYVCGEQAHFE